MSTETATELDAALLDRTDLTTQNCTFDLHEELQHALPELPKDKRKGIEASVAQHGKFTDPLIVWWETGLLLDGHNRWDIWNNLPPDMEVQPPGVRYVSLGTDDFKYAILWLKLRHYDRRDYSPKQIAELRGLAYEFEKQRHGDPQRMCTNAPSGRICHLEQNPTKTAQNGKKRGSRKPNSKPPKSTAKQIADRTGVSPRTVREHEKYAKALGRIRKYDTSLGNKLANDTGWAMGEVIKIGKLDESEFQERLREIKNGKASTNGRATKQKKAKKKKSRKIATNSSDQFNPNIVPSLYKQLTRAFEEYYDQEGMSNSQPHCLMLDLANLGIDAWETPKQAGNPTLIRKIEALLHGLKS